MIAPLPLRARTLRALAARGVAVPAYDRPAVTPSVVHISVGSFHRAHQALYFDELAQRGISTGWGVVGVGLHRPEMRAALTAQDGLYTVLARGTGGDAARVVGAIRRYLFAPEHGFAVTEALADPRTRLVTLTVTGHGYRLDADDDVGVPATALGFLVEALARRRRAGLPPFTVLSCDNIAGNGAVARAAVLGLAGRRDPRLAAWIERYGAFPSSMVDRITPRTTDADRARLAREHGVIDRWPVVTEPFSQWVVEDAFADTRPPLDEVGVELVADVTPYALAKTRLLNGSHCALGHLGALAGHATIDAAVRDPALRAYVDALMASEVAPLLPPVPRLDLAAYRATLLQRFANPTIADPLERLRRNGSAKMPEHVISSLAEARARRRPHPLLTLSVAAWLRCLRGTDERGRPLALEDPRGAELQVLAAAGGLDALLTDRALFGDLAGDPAVAAEVTQAVAALDRDGVHAAVRAALSGEGRVAA